MTTTPDLNGLERPGCEPPAEIDRLALNAQRGVLRLAAELRAVRADLAGLRAELGREIHTGRIVLADTDKTTTIEPGMVQLHHRRTESDDSGAFVLLTAMSHSGEMVAGAVLRECDDPMVYAAIGASTEIEPASAYVALNTHKSVGGESHEIAVAMEGADDVSTDLDDLADIMRRVEAATEALRQRNGFAAWRRRRDQYPALALRSRAPRPSTEAQVIDLSSVRAARTYGLAPALTAPPALSSADAEVSRSTGRHRGASRSGDPREMRAGCPPRC